MGLKKYLQKRHFGKTPEPAGTKKGKKSAKLAFVVQKHDASHLHYDFRLELDGVLKSWAVPKGPSLSPHEHHLAIMTEDHPYEYRKFKGVIPEGNYGAGTVEIWDEGWYEPRHESNDQQKMLRSGLKKGHLVFMLHGQKLKGEFALIKMEKMGEKNWLLVKKGDEFASDQEVVESTEPPDISKYPKKAKPWATTPMLCTLVTEPFSEEGWLFEVKWDGYRAIGSKKGNKLELYSRNGIDFTQKFPQVNEALSKLKHDVILDGEIVAVDKDGVAHFEWLQNWQRDNSGDLAYFAFDILWCDGRDLREMPLVQRKKLLHSILPRHGLIKYSDHVQKNGLSLFKKMKSHHLEGMVAKKIDSKYLEGVRGRDWLKVKTHMRQEVVIGGYTEPRGGRKFIGSLVVGVYDKGELMYVGHSGGGIADAPRKELLAKLQKIERAKSPFKTEPKPNAPVHWVQPKFVCEMSFSEWTREGYMRQPEFKGLREDKKPQAVHREKPKSLQIVENPAGIKMPNAPFEFTHLDKVFFPHHKYTKGDMINYYQAVAKYILPYIKDRPCSLLRQPDGITGMSFFQKNMEHLPGWAPHADIFSDSNNANLRWLVGGDINTLLYMVQLGCVEINPWSSRVNKLNFPDWLVIDLDPEGVEFTDVIKVAHTVRDVCKDWGVTALPKTSGKTGIHIYVPLQAKYSYEQAKNFAHLMAIEINKRQPDLTSVERMPKKRPHKIYLDFLQNRQGQTLAAPYSLRPTSDACVSTPLHWDEVQSSLRPTDFTIKNIERRLNRVGDLWRPVLGKGVNLPTVLKKLEKS